MTAKKKAKVPAQKPAGDASSPPSKGFTPEERALMRERLRELKAAQGKEEAEAAVMARIASMPQPDRRLAERVHAIIESTAPELAAKLWYSMPAYAKDGDVVCFFQDGQKFKARYSTLGFTDKAKIDDGEMWPTSYALKELSPAVEKRIAALVRKAVR
jgi:uncharacterized protein YdhG (YjbR/CyaY superfamily)